jgi:hypothetical protein
MRSASSQQDVSGAVPVSFAKRFSRLLDFRQLRVRCSL